MPENVPKTPSASMPPASAEPEIHVIPEKFYGAALKARAIEAHQKKTEAPATMAPPQHKMTVPIILGSVAFLLILGGIFVFLNWKVLFPPPAPPAPVVTAPSIPAAPAPEPPATPSNIIATSTNSQSVNITWVDNATNESGFRVERAVDGKSFQSITNLPPNSTSFQDIAISASTTYRYRIIAVNQTGDSAPSSEARVFVSPLPPPPKVIKLPPAGLDSDSDGLTDLEEALFGTNIHNPDTDEDGFLDGNEVFNLYNPNGRAPSTLLNAGLVKQESGTIGWTMLIPKVWTLTQTVPDGSKATIDTGKAEKFTISVEDNANYTPIVKWYLAHHPSVQASQILQYRSKKGYKGIIGADLLATYIPWGKYVFVFTYHLNGQPFINYRTTYSMMLNSLTLTGLPQISPPVAGSSLPFEPAATTTGVIAQPKSIFPTASTTSITPTISTISTTPAASVSTGTLSASAATSSS